MPTSHTNPEGFKDFRSRLGKYASSSNKPAIEWSTVAQQAEVGLLVHVLTDEGVPVRFNRSRDKSTLILTMLVDGEAQNVYLESREDWVRVLTDMTG